MTPEELLNNSEPANGLGPHDIIVISKFLINYIYIGSEGIEIIL